MNQGPDMTRVSKAMDAAHASFHGPGGWNHCELDPCHTVMVFLGEVALFTMTVTVDEERE